MNAHARDCPHRGLNSLWIPDVCCVLRTENVCHAEPVGHADYSSEISRVLDIVQTQTKAVATGRFKRYVVRRNLEESYHLLRMLLQACTR